MKKQTAAAMLALFCAYGLAFLVSGAAAPDALVSAAINVSALAAAGLVASGLLILGSGVSLGSWKGLAAHALGSIAFTFFWYFLILAGEPLLGTNRE